MNIDINDGEDFRAFFVQKAFESGLYLEDKITSLDKSPIIKNSIQQKDKYLFILDFKKKEFEIEIPLIEYEIQREGLSFLFGNGNLSFNYELDIFAGLRPIQLRHFKRLAVEVFDFSVHKAWMTLNNYFIHNGTKDIRFFRYAASEDSSVREKGIDRHNLQSNQYSEIDTPHHSITFSRFIWLLDRDLCPDILIEMLYDQSSVAGRWYKKAKNFNSIRHDEYQKDFKEKDVVFKEQDKVYFWENPKEKMTVSEFELYIWDLWSKINDEYCSFWIEKFGNRNEEWKPPTNLSDLEDLV